MNSVVKKNNRGQSLVETALVLPIILLMLLGILEFGRILSAWMIITHGSREGARLASLGGTNTQITARVKAVSNTLNLGSMTVTISPSSNRSTGAMVTVRVNYSVDLLTPFIGAIIGDPLPMNAKTTMRVE